MSKLLKKTLPVTLLAVTVVGSTVATVPTASSAQEISNLLSAPTAVEQVAEKPTYTIMDKYTYRFSKAFEGSPDTFEAWVNMPSGSIGGTLMSNVDYISGHGDYPMASWSVDAIGRISINWDNENYKYTFKNANIDDGTWHHVAVVRDPAADTFTLYVDGELKDSVKSDQDDLGTGRMPMCVGVGYENFYSRKTPFEGYIRQVTVYEGAITQERVRQDMQTAEITDDYNGQIMGNWNFGEEWTERIVKDTTANANDADLWTFDKYIGMDEDDGFEWDYSFICLPDVQTCARYHEDVFSNMMQWIVNNKEKEKIAFVWQVGDLSDVGSNESLYERTARHMSKLNGVVPYSFVQGNHDYDDNAATRGSTYFDKHFPYALHSRLPGFGGAYEEGTMANTYYLYDIGDVSYCVINLEFSPRKSVLRWAGRVCEMYPQHRVIVATHAYMGQDGNIMTGETNGSDASRYGASKDGEGASGQSLFDDLLQRHPNIFMATSGHVCGDNIMRRTDPGVNGNTVLSMLVDGQVAVSDPAYGVGEDMMLLMRVNEATKTFRAYFYSPRMDAVFNLQNQFEYCFADANNPAIGA